MSTTQPPNIRPASNRDLDGYVETLSKRIDSVSNSVAALNRTESNLVKHASSVAASLRIICWVWIISFGLNIIFLVLMFLTPVGMLIFAPSVGDKEHQKQMKAASERLNLQFENLSRQIEPGRKSL